MDPISAFLDGPRARRAFLLRMVLSAPWSLRIADHAPLSVIVVASGDLWLLPDVGRPERLRAGDVALLRGPDEYVIADELGRRPQALIDEGQQCTPLDGVDRPIRRWSGIRTWGDSGSDGTVVLSGTYSGDGELGWAVAAALPPVAVVRASIETEALVNVLASGLEADGPGQDVVLDRSLDLLLVVALRAWLSGADERPGWFSASADPIVGPALALMQSDPAEPWTVATLAGRVGSSRAAFARRFRAMVGEPPLGYLTRWRLRLAADLLHDGSRTVAAIASEVGYGSAFALSTAFRREFGRSPTDYRRRSPRR